MLRNMVRCVPLMLMLVLLLALAVHRASAFDPNEIPVAEGYVTAVLPNFGFEVDGEKVAILRDTQFGISGSDKTTFDVAMRDRIHIGTYVSVYGASENTIVKARSIFLRDEWKKNVSGIGTIQHMSGAGTDAIFLADGYVLQLTPKTKLTFVDKIDSLSDVSTGTTWLRFQGRRDAGGTVILAKADFIRFEEDNKEPKAGEFGIAFTAPDFDHATEGSVQLNHFARRAIPADRPLHERIERVGEKLIPAYQKTLADQDPSKIHFEFYAINDDKMKAEWCSPHGGLILLSTAMVAKLETDDELAALLADGIASAIEHQAEFSRNQMHKELIWGALAGGAGGLTGAAIATAIVRKQGPGDSLEQFQEEQRGRVAL